MPTPTEIYVEGFLARCRARETAGRPLVRRPGVDGLLATADDGRVRLVVTDDRAAGDLAAALTHARSGTVTVYAAATTCAQLLSTRAGWRADPATAMARRGMPSSPAPPLPPGLGQREIRRVATDDPGGVPLADAVALVRADARERATGAADLIEHLVSLPATTRLLAAVDADGQVCATSGYGVFDGHAHVIFVNTAERWRGRGVGTAMTGVALHAARADGACHAHLDASASGRGLYERLGFEVVAPVLRFALS